MIYALDTNIVSYILKKDEKVTGRLKAAIDSGNYIVIPPIVYYEVRRSLLASGAAAKAAAFEAIFADLRIDDIDRDTLEMAAAEYARLRKFGVSVGDADLFIAEYCVKNGYTLVTNNTKHFEVIENLKYTNWVE
jgi:predicted nucleic acid-binding protein